MMLLSNNRHKALKKGVLQKQGRIVKSWKTRLALFGFLFVSLQRRVFYHSHNNILSVYCRFFILNFDTLRYYSKGENESPYWANSEVAKQYQKGEVVLSGGGLVHEMKVRGKPFVFELVAGKRKLLMRAGSKKEMDSWIDAINQCLIRDSTSVFAENTYGEETSRGREKSLEHVSAIEAVEIVRRQQYEILEKEKQKQLDADLALGVSAILRMQAIFRGWQGRKKAQLRTMDVKTIEELREGKEVIRYSSKGKQLVRFLYFNDSEGPPRLSWSSKKWRGDAGLLLKDVTGILMGELWGGSPSKAKKDEQVFDSCCCMSFVSKKRSLDLQLRSAEERDNIERALKVYMQGNDCKKESKAAVARAGQ